MFALRFMWQLLAIVAVSGGVAWWLGPLYALIALLTFLGLFAFFVTKEPFSIATVIKQLLGLLVVTALFGLIWPSLPMIMAVGKLKDRNRLDRVPNEIVD